MSIIRRAAVLFSVALISATSASAFDLQSTTVPGRAPGAGGAGTPLTNVEIAINRADKSLIFKNVDGTLGYGSLLNALPAGRKAVEQGDASDLTVGSGAPTLSNTLAGKAPLASPAFTGSGSLITGRTAPPNFDGAEMSFQNTATTGHQIYGPQVPPGWFYRDVVRSTAVALPGNTATNTNAFGYYVANYQSAGGLGQNATGLFGTTACLVDGSACWGINPTLIDNLANGVVTTGTGRSLIGAEFDFSVTSPHTIVQGMGVHLGSSFAQPAGADGFGCFTFPSSAAKWTNCLVIPDGNAVTGAIFGGTTSAGPNVSSIPIKFGIYDSNSLGHYVQISAFPLGTASAFKFSDNTLANGVAISNSAAGGPPTIFATGNDANINLYLSGKAGGNVQIASAGGVCTHIAGTSTETVVCSSDERLKTDIVDTSPGLDPLDGMRVRDFTVKANGERRTGVIAQEMQKTHPDMVHEGSDGMLTVEEPNPWLLVRAAQELRSEINSLRWESRIVEALLALGLVSAFMRRSGQLRI